MTREKIVNEANNWNNDNIPLVTREIERLCRRAFMAGYNAAMNEADAHPHWISVEDELPPEDKEVLIYREETKETMVVTYENEEWYERGHHPLCLPVSHWKFLPQPPKKGE